MIFYNDIYISHESFPWLVQSCTCSIVFQKPVSQNILTCRQKTKTSKQISDTNFVTSKLKIPYPCGWGCPEDITSSLSLNYS